MELLGATSIVPDSGYPFRWLPCESKTVTWHARAEFNDLRLSAQKGLSKAPAFEVTLEEVVSTSHAAYLHFSEHCTPSRCASPGLHVMEVRRASYECNSEEVHIDDSIALCL